MNMKTILRALAVLLTLSLLAVPALAAEEPEIDYDALDNETAVYVYLTEEMGLNNAAACGVMANIQHESGFQPDIWGDGGTSLGLCQWHAGRCRNLQRFCRENGYDVESVYGQMAYLQYELETSYPYVLEALESAEDTPQGAYDAAWYWCYWFEIPADRWNQADSRGASARDTYYPWYADFQLEA